MHKQTRFLDFYQKIIALNSISSDAAPDDISNEGVIDLLQQELSALGFVCQKIPVVKSNHKFNLIAKFGTGTGGLAFCGHTDTVPTDPTLWQSDPFTLTQRENKLFGLGVIDMKGFFAFAMEAIKSMDLKLLQKPLYVIATADEETDMQGAIELTNMCAEKPDLMIIGEPTSMVPVIMHKGHLVQSITVQGTGGHSSNPKAGLNAIKVMHEVITNLIQLEEDLQQKYQQPLFPIPYPTSNIGIIKGGDAPNRICQTCEIMFDIRPIPGTTLEMMRQETKAHLQDLFVKYGDRIKLYEPYAGVEPFGGALDKNIQSFLEEITGNKAIAVNYATEATYFQNIAPTVILGAGSIAMAHQPNEYLDMTEITPMLTILDKLIHKFCI